MTTSPALADVQNKTVTFEGTTYKIQDLGEEPLQVGDGAAPLSGAIVLLGAVLHELLPLLDGLTLGLSAATTLVLLVCSAFVFTRMEKSFADVI